MIQYQSLEGDIMYKKIELFVGGSTDQHITEKYKKAAVLLGKKANDRGYRIIFDGCKGLPSLVYDQLEYLNYGTIVYDCYHSLAKEYNNCLYGPNIISLNKQSDVTKALIDNSDALFFMKGGIGTIAEITQAIDKKKNKEHDKPIVILNLENSWDELITFLNTFNLSDLYYVTDNVIDGLNHIERELYSENSKFYSDYLKYSSCLERDYPIIEEIPIKSYKFKK